MNIGPIILNNQLEEGIEILDLVSLPDDVLGESAGHLDGLSAGSGEVVATAFIESDG